jgi:hypothetical protein
MPSVFLACFEKLGVYPSACLSAINFKMSDFRHTVVRSDNFVGCGYLPHRTPDHQLELLIGNMPLLGGVAFGLLTICLTRNQVFSSSFVVIVFSPLENV